MITKHRHHQPDDNTGSRTQIQCPQEENYSSPKTHFMRGMRPSLLRFTALKSLPCRLSSPNGLGHIKSRNVSRWAERLVILVVVGIVIACLQRRDTREGCNGGPLMTDQVFSPNDRNDSNTSEAGGAEWGDPSDASPRVAVCFFGLTRSLRWTLPSVRGRLLDVLRQGGMRVDVFVHTFDLMEVNNERAGEKNIDYTAFVGDFSELHPIRSLVTNQDDFDLAWPEPLSLTHYNWNYPPDLVAGLIRNVFRAYWSTAMVWGLMAQYASEEGFQYDAVVLARPDVWFHVDTDLPRRTFPLPERTVFLPSFETNLQKGGRKNDRFAYGSVDTMRVMMNRIAILLDANAGRFQGEIDSEWVMGRNIDSNNISVQTMEFSVTRVRLTGDIPRFDHGRVKDACDAGVDPMACEMVRLGYRFPVGAREHHAGGFGRARTKNND